MAPPAPRCTLMFRVLISVRGEHGGAEAKLCRTPRALPGVCGVRNPLPAAPALPVMRCRREPCRGHRADSSLPGKLLGTRRAPWGL